MRAVAAILVLAGSSWPRAARASVTQDADHVRISVESFVPAGDDQDACADEIIVDLDEPLGDRAIIDEVRGVELTPQQIPGG